MWTFTDTMFQSEAQRLEEEQRQEAVRFLDRLAMRVLNGDVTLDSLNAGVHPDQYGQIATSERASHRLLEVEYHDPEVSL